MYTIKASEYDVKHIIQVDIEVEYDSDKIAASNDLSIKKKYKLDEVKQTLFETIFSNVCKILEKKNFEILEVYQSKKGNTGYITFYPVTLEGEILDVIQIKFRISDHPSKSIGKSDKVPKTVKIVSFVVTDHVFNNNVDFLLEIDDLCDELQSGNIDVLDEYEQKVI